MESSIAKIRMAIHTPTHICVLLFALRHNLINRPVASFWKVCNSKNIEAVKYSVEGQASHTGKRYLYPNLQESCFKEIETHNMNIF